MEWPYGKPLEFIEKTFAQIADEVMQRYRDCTFVEGSITPVIDDPTHLLPAGECEACGGPCRWEDVERYGEEEESK